MRTGTGFSLEVAQAGQLLVLRGRLDVRMTADVRPALAHALGAGSGARALARTRLDRVLRTTRTAAFA